MPAIRNSAKAIIIEEDSLPAIRHTDQAGDWYSLPGGGQNFNETLDQALRRECLEETGASVEIGRLKFIREYIGKNHEFADTDGDCHQVEFFFECKIRGKYVIKNGFFPDQTQIGVSWVALDELETFRLYPAVLRPILKQRRHPPGVTYLGDIN